MNHSSRRALSGIAALSGAVSQAWAQTTVGGTGGTFFGRGLQAVRTEFQGQGPTIAVLGILACGVFFLVDSRRGAENLGHTLIGCGLILGATGLGAWIAGWA